MLGRMTTGQKIIASFVCAFALLAAMGVVALVNTERMSGAIGNLADRKLPTLAALAKLDEAKTAAARGLNAMLLRKGDAAFRGEIHAVYVESLRRMDEAATAYEAIPTMPRRSSCGRR
jgi:CHASE3 domain sensor protein